MKAMSPDPRTLHKEAIDEIPDTDNLRAFTWVPDPARYPSYDAKAQYKLLLSWVLLTADKYFSKFGFCPELTENGNIHIHGWFVIKDKIKYYKWFLPRCKRLGYVCVKKSPNEKWFEYTDKDIDMMKELMRHGRVPIPLTHLNIKEYKDLFNEKKLKPKKIIKRLKYIPTKTSILDYINK